MNKKISGEEINSGSIERNINYREGGSSNRKLEDLVRKVIIELGENPEREGLVRTPIRFADAYRFLTRGYAVDENELLNNAIFNVSYDEIVIVKDIDFYSLCEHHILPFYGKCHVAYIPNKKVIGLSKIPRVIEMYSRRLQVQERMTRQIGDLLFRMLEPQGVAVVCEARHLCMMMRGVEKQNSVAATSCMLGVFKENAKTRDEFLRLIS